MGAIFFYLNRTSIMPRAKKHSILIHRFIWRQKKWKIFSEGKKVLIPVKITRFFVRFDTLQGSEFLHEERKKLFNVPSAYWVVVIRVQSFFSERENMRRTQNWVTWRVEIIMGTCWCVAEVVKRQMKEMPLLGDRR